MAQASKLMNVALEGLNPRQKEVLSARFGLEGAGEGETLAAIGDRLKVTRERVRQIEASGTSLAKANLMKNADAAALLDKVKKYIAAQGGVAKKSDVVRYAATLAKGIFENQLNFLGEASGAFSVYREDEDFFPFYYGSEKDLREAKAFVENWIGHLKARKEKVFGGSYAAQLASFVKAKSVDQAVAENYLGIAKHIRTNPYGDVGLRDWPEINPTTVRDKIYLVLKKKGEPLHFEDIARSINAVGFDADKALAPTVHNELIKDARFVLVGRGMYALREHGYEPGTAREVIARLLKTEGPMKADDVLVKVNRQRFFKPNTVLINLQNRNFFERMSDGKYRVREA
jgi:Sigma-70, region 4/HB1, ASXL, restriction endonuclease HTH domain